MINKARLAASSIIVAGAALVGAAAGWDAAPVTISFPAEHTAICGGAFAAILAAVACNFARERAEARAQVFESLLRLEEKRRPLRVERPVPLESHAGSSAGGGVTTLDDVDRRVPLESHAGARLGAARTPRQGCSEPRGQAIRTE